MIMFKYPPEEDGLTEEQRVQKRIYDRISKLETHIINLIHPIQNLTKIVASDTYIQRLTSLLEQPLRIDDTQLRPYLDKFMDEIRNFVKKTENINFSQTHNEIKYIGKRLLEIEERLKKIEEGGKKNQLTLSVNYNGKDLVERDKNQDALAHPDVKTPKPLNIQNVLTVRELKIYQMRMGLNGFPKTTFKKIAIEINLSLEQTRLTFKRSERKIRIAESKRKQ